MFSPRSLTHPSTMLLSAFRVTSFSHRGGSLYEPRTPSVPVVYVTEPPEGFVKQTFFQERLDEGKISAGWDDYRGKDVPKNVDSGNKGWEGHKWKYSVCNPPDLICVSIRA